MPDRLKGGDGAPELDALERVQARQLECRPGRADQLVRDGELAGGYREVPVHRAQGLGVAGGEVAGDHHETEVGVEAPHRGHPEDAPFDGNGLGGSVRGAGDHDRAFDEKWLKSPSANRSSLLGSPDTGSLAVMSLVYEHVERMQLLPWDKKALTVLVAAALLPMVPLLGTVTGLTEILSMLGKFMV